tara:strand:+ start:267 stop:1019 length:753 start_codon:yes stop_codon:yes gene_type:complete
MAETQKTRRGFLEHALSAAAGGALSIAAWELGLRKLITQEESLADKAWSKDQKVQPKNQKDEPASAPKTTFEHALDDLDEKIQRITQAEVSDPKGVGIFSYNQSLVYHRMQNVFLNEYEKLRYHIRQQEPDLHVNEKGTEYPAHATPILDNFYSKFKGTYDSAKRALHNTKFKEGDIQYWYNACNITLKSLEKYENKNVDHTSPLLGDTSTFDGYKLEIGRNKKRNIRSLMDELIALNKFRKDNRIQSLY